MIPNLQSVKTSNLFIGRTVKPAIRGVFFVLVALLAVLKTNSLSAQSTSFLGFPIAYWDFESNAARSTTSETTPEMQINTGNTFDGKVGGTTTVSQRAGNGVTWAGSAGSAISATTWPTTSTSPGTAATHYFQFSLNTTGFTGISLGVDVFTGITAAAYPAVGIIYSTDGGSTWASGFTGTLGSNNTWVTRYFSMPAAADNNPNLKVRIYGYWGALNANSVIGLDNLILLATGMQANAGAKTSLDEGVLVTSYTSGTAPSAANLYNRYGGFTITSGSELIINNTSATSGPKIVSGGTVTCASGGTVTFGVNGIITGAGGFNLQSGGILKTAHLSGITSSGATGSVQNTGTRTFSAGANYVYNGAGAQVTGNGLPTSFVAPGSVSVNNTSGVTLSQATAFATGDTVNLINGAFTITPGLTLNSGAYIQRDMGTISATPTMTGVNLVYKNLGVGGNATTANEMPATGTSTTAIGSLLIAKSGATITLGNGPTVNGALTISAGSLSGAALTLTAKGSWTNNATFNAGTGTVIFNGSTAQSVAGSSVTAFNNLTVNNSNGLAISANTTVTGTLNFISGILDMSTYTLTVNGNVTGAGTTSYVKGNLEKPVTGINPVSFEVGDNSYAPALFTFNSTPTAGTVSAKSSAGVDPALAGSGISSTAIVMHYWSVAASGLSGPSTVVPKFTYNLADIGGGTNTGFVGQRYSGGSWLGSTYAATNTSAPYTSQPASSLSTAAFSGNYIFGKAVPQLIAAVGATVDAPFAVTFTEDATFRAGITQIKVGSNILPPASYNTTVAGQVTFDPSLSVYLQTAGTFVITMTSTGYGDDAVSQSIGAGAPTNLGMLVQPAAPPSNGAALSVQPVVVIRDQYNNTTTSTATVTASTGAGSWTIGGSLSVAGVSGTVTFAGLTASSGALVTGATISFTSPGLTAVESTTFNIPRPPFSGTINVPGDYPTLGQAINAVNQVGLSGPVIINCTADQLSTTTAGNVTEGSVTGAIGSGYVISVTGAYAPTATNTLTIRGNNKTITTPVLPTASNYNDAVFTISGTSYVTIDNFVMVENAANTTSGSSNNMTEIGVAIVRGTSGTSGAQYNTISNCKILLNSSYTNYVGIYSNSRNIVTSAYTASSSVTSAAGANSYNAFYKDTIVGATSGIVLIGDATYNDINTVVGALNNSDSVLLGNRTANMNMGTPYLNYSVSQQDGVYAINNFNINVNYNKIVLPSGSTTNTVNGVYVNTCATGSTFSTQVSNNKIVLRTAGSTQYTGIRNASGSLTNATLKINSNTISLFGVNGVMYGVYNTGNAVTANFNNNVINDTNTSGTGCFALYSTGSLGTASFNNNVSFNQTATGSITGISTATGAITSCTYDNNRIRTLVTGNPTVGSYGIYNNGVAIPSPSFTGNNVTITAASNSGFNMMGIYNTGASSTVATFLSDTVSVVGPGYGIVNAANVGTASFSYNVLNITPGAYTCFGLYHQGDATLADFNNNTIATPVGTTGSFYGININTGTVATSSINNNNINLYAGAAAYGISLANTGTTVDVSNNNIVMRQTGNGNTYGIYYVPATALPYSSFNNNVVDLTTTTATSGTVGYIYLNPAAANALGQKNNVNNNIFKSAAGFTNTTGIIYCVYMNYENPTDSICYNRTQAAAGVGGTISKTGSGGEFYGINFNFNGSAYNTTTLVGNNFSNISVTGTANFHGINDGTSSAQGRYIDADTIANITGGSGFIVGVLLDFCSPNAQVSNCRLSNFSGTGGVYGIALGAYSSPATSSTSAGGGIFFNNTISGLSSSGASAVVSAIHFNGSATGVNNAYNNDIGSLSTSGNTLPTIFGINNQRSLTANIYGNYIHDFTATTTTGSVVTNGIYILSGTTNSIYTNRVNNLSAGTSAGSSTQVIGLNMVSSAVSNTYNVYNNFITNLTAPSSNNPNSLLGIFAQSATLNTWNVYYNTIGMGIGGSAITSSATNFGAAGLLFGNITSSVLNMGDNIIYMNVAPRGTGIAACLQRNATGTANTSVSNTLLKPNNNIYYTNSSAKNYLYVDAVTGGAGTIRNGYAQSGLTVDVTNNIKNDADFNQCGSLYKAFMGSGRESKTSTENNLVSAGTTGTYYPSGASYAYGTGAAPSSPAITTDFSGATRANPPSIGALEFIGTAPSAGAAPTINYTALGATSYCIAAPPTLTAAITSGSGVATTAGTKPRLYYRGSADANAFASTNTSGSDGWKWVEASNSTSPFTFTPDYSILNHTVTAGTVISYFVIAQDMNTTPLVSANVVGFAANYCPTGVALTSGAFPAQALPAINTYSVITLPGSFTALVTPGILCGNTATAVLALSPAASDLVLQWKQDYGSGFANIPGATTDNYSTVAPTIAGTSATVTYKADVYCNGVLQATSSTAATTEYSPTVSGTTPASRCGTGSVTLAATTPGGTLQWYTAATGGLPVATGPSYVTPSLSTSTVFYVSDTFGHYGSPQSIGLTNVSTATLFNITGGPGTGINFTVNNTSVIQSVKIYPYYSGTGATNTFTISVYSGSTIVASYTGTVAGAVGGGTAQVVPVNFYLPPGNYQMAFSAVGTNAASQYGSASGFSFPYTINPNTITLTSTTFAPYYFFFHDWKVMAACSSPRVAVSATIDPLPTAGAVAATPGTLCAGATLTLSETGTPSGSGAISSYSWSGPDGYSSTGAGPTVNPASFAPSSAAASGVYSLTVTYPGTGCTSNPVVTPYVTVNTNNVPVISGTLSACVGGTRNLTADVPAGTWSSSSTAIATIDATLGIVTAVSAGTTTITYTTPCGAYGIATFTVNTTPGAIGGATDICISTVTTLTNAVAGGTWSSSNPFAATINASTGVAGSGVSTGSTTISYTIGSCGVASVLNVSNTTPGAITGSASVCVGGITTLSCTPAGGTWSSSSTGLATVGVSSGAVTGVAPGMPTITYSTGCGTPATYNVTVNGSSISLSTNGPVCSGATASLVATVSPGTYSWVGPNLFSSALQNPTISNVTPAAAGNYTFTSTVAGCSNSSTVFLVVGSSPTVSVTASPSSLCIGASSSLASVVSGPSSFMLNAIEYEPVILTSPTGTLTSASSWIGGNDDGYINVSLPFTFSLFGSNYGSVNISANGYVNFATGFSSGAYAAATLPSTSSAVPKSMIALFWHDMVVSSGNITYGVMGAAPNRKFIINYNSIPDASGLDVNNGQIILYETTNNIELMVAATANSVKTCGVQNAAGTTAITVPGQNNASYAVTAAAPQGWRFARPSYIYAWSPSASLSSSSIYNPVASGLTSSQVYTVTTADIYSSCSGNVSTASIAVAPVPVISSVAAEHTEVCSGAAQVLTASAPTGGIGSFVSYVWTGPGGYSSTVTSVGTTTITATPNVTGSYSVVANYSGSGCTSAPAVTSVVNVYPQPDIIMMSGSTASLCSGSPLTLSATTVGGVTGSAVSYSWSGPDVTTVTSASSPSPVLTPTAAGTNLYQLTYHNGGFGCVDDLAGVNVTVNANPTFSLGAVPSICQPLTTVPVSYSSTGSPVGYTIDWSAAANSDGFVDVPSASLSGGSVTLSIPPAGTPGYYTGTITATSAASCVSNSGSFGIRIYGQPHMSITAVNTPCVGYAGSIDFTGTDSADVNYTVDGGPVNHFTFSGTSYSLSTGIINTTHTYVIQSASNPVCSNTYDSIRVVDPIPMRWMGGASGHESEWDYAANWSCGFVPTNIDDVTVDAATYTPSIPASGSGTAHDLTMLAGSGLSIGSGAQLNVKGNLNNNSSIMGAGKVVMNNTTAQTISGIGTINNFELNNAAGATINTGSRMKIAKVLYVSAGTLVTNDSLELLSSDTFTPARIAELPSSGAAISGKVMVDQFIQGGYRRFRFWSHPFSDTMSMQQIHKYIDITGPGGSANGFQTTITNAPSAFRYDPYTSNSTLSYDIGWKNFTNITSGAADTNMLHPGQGIRLFFRGAKGQGMSIPESYGYTPLSTTVKMLGNVNQGDVDITLAQGSDAATQSINMVGNPYASPVDIGTILYNAKQAGKITGSAFYVWLPRVAFGGQYMAVPIGVGAPVPYYLQANASFQVFADHDGAQLHFAENNKSGNIDNYLFKSPSDFVTLNVYDNNGHVWDRLDLQFNDKATDATDKLYDAKKILGPDLNFYAIANDGVKMAIDARPFSDDRVIPLGITSAYTQDFVIRAENVSVPGGGVVTLHDKLLNKYVDMNAGTEYAFTIGKDKATQGNDRFELTLKPATSTIAQLAVSLKPNPASDDVKITFTSGSSDNVNLRVMDISGVAIYSKELGNKANGVVTVPMSNFAAGVYLVEVTQGNQKVVQRLIKE